VPSDQRHVILVAIPTIHSIHDHPSTTLLQAKAIILPPSSIKLWGTWRIHTLLLTDITMARSAMTVSITTLTSSAIIRLFLVDNNCTVPTATICVALAEAPTILLVLMILVMLLALLALLLWRRLTLLVLALLVLVTLLLLMLLLVLLWPLVLLVLWLALLALLLLLALLGLLKLLLLWPLMLPHGKPHLLRSIVRR
jgi:hypothetical protein